MELTSRELDVLRLAAEGCSMEITGQRLFISLNTVREHRKKTLKKLGAINMTHAVAIAFRRGILLGEGFIFGGLRVSFSRSSALRSISISVITCFDTPSACNVAYTLGCFSRPLIDVLHLVSILSVPISSHSCLGSKSVSIHTL